MSSVLSDPSDRKVSEFRALAGIISFANFSHESSNPPKFFIGIGKTNFGIDSSSEQHDLTHMGVFGVVVVVVLVVVVVFGVVEGVGGGGVTLVFSVLSPLQASGK